ncbi:MAG: hypothetical protein SOV61_02665 [Lachnospiraceae bacterium]|nr:hypothetical protein [Lachnospiraceae bacterium]
MIRVSKPQKEVRESTVRLKSEVQVGNEKKNIWIEVNHKYEQYLCDELSDGFFAFLYPYAKWIGYAI